MLPVPAGEAEIHRYDLNVMVKFHMGAKEPRGEALNTARGAGWRGMGKLSLTFIALK